MAKRKTPIDDLARMVQRGFKDVAGKVEMGKGFAAVNKRFDVVEDRLERIEKLMLVDHKRRIERLEEQVKDLRELLAIK